MMTRKQHVNYWLRGAAENMKDMKAAVISKRRSNAMFCGHLVVEKMLKSIGNQCSENHLNLYQ